MPPWCSLITRIVKPKSDEARYEGGKKALQKELANMISKNVWDTNDVYCLQDLLNHPDMVEVML